MITLLSLYLKKSSEINRMLPYVRYCRYFIIYTGTIIYIFGQICSVTKYRTKSLDKASPV